MADVDAGAAAPAPVTNAPGALPVDAPAVPTGQEQASESVQPARTYSEEEHRKAISERLAKERRRIERTVRAEAERDLYKRELETSRQPKQQDQPSSQKPLQKDFPDWETWNEAVTDWKVEQRLSKVREEGTAQQQQREAQQSEAQLARSIQDNFKAAAEKYSDFHEVVTAEGLPFYKGSPILAYVARSKVGGEIAYHLGNDRDEAIRIDGLHPIDQVLALRDLESKLTAAPAASKAPAPIVPNGTQASTRKGWTEMTTAEHVKAYRDKKRHRST